MIGEEFSVGLLGINLARDLWITGSKMIQLIVVKIAESGELKKGLD